MLSQTATVGPLTPARTPKGRTAGNLRRSVLTMLALALVLVGAASAVSPSSAFSTPLAQFNRVAFSNAVSPSDSHLQVAVVQESYYGPTYVQSLRAADPGIKVVIYQALWWMRPGDKLGYSDCLAGTGSYPSSWYLHNSSGGQEVWSPGTTSAKYAMDFANSSYLSTCVANMITKAKAMGADGVFLDGSPTSVHWAQLPSSCSISPPASPTCATDANLQNAMTSALAYLDAQMHANGMIAISNISGGNVNFCCHGGSAVWQRYVSQVDGAMQESWTYGTNHLPLPASEVTAGLSNTTWSEANGKYTLLNDDILNCEACDDYGLATMLLVASGRSSYDTANGSYNGTYGTWWPSFSLAQGLGAPLGPYTTLPDKLMVRQFANGWVAVNDTTLPIADPTYGTVAATSAIIN